MPFFKEGERREVPPKPLALVNIALKSAAEGREYYGGTRDNFNTSLLAGLRLDTPDPDGLGLMERFAGETNIQVLRSMIPTIRMMKNIDALLQTSLEKRTNGMQEELGEDLAQVAIRQFEREGHVCPGVTRMILSAPDRFLGDSDVKAQVFRKNMEARGEKEGAAPEDIDVVTTRLLHSTGVQSYPEISSLPQVFIRDASGMAIDLGDVPDVIKKELLLGAFGNLDKLWLQPNQGGQPYLLIPSKDPSELG